MQLVGREQLMASEFIAYLIKDELAEKRVEWEQEWQTQLEQALRQTVEETIVARFPALPTGLLTALGSVQDAAGLQRLHHDVLYAPDQGSVERLLGGDHGV